MPEMNEMSKAVFLDKDGTIVKEIPGEEHDNEGFGYLLKTDQVELIDGAAEAIAKLKQAGYKTIIITNQSAIARGWLTEEKLSDINNRMNELLIQSNPDAVIDSIYYCPFHKEGVVEKYTGESNFRKPNTGMVMEAKDKFNIDLSKSYMIGDSLTDMQCGNNAGLKNVLVLTGYGKVTKKNGIDEKVKIEFIADNISEAVNHILDNETKNN